VIAGVGTIGLVGAAGFLAYRYFAGSAPAKKSRSKHGKKDKKKKSSDDAVKAPVPSKSGTSTPRTPPRSDSPPVPTKPVADSSRMDQLAWFIEIAKDQFEARGLRHAKYYADKALELGSNVQDFKDTLSYAQMRYVSIFVSPDRESKFTDLKAVADLLTKMEPTEGGKQEFVLYKGRVLSTLSDAAVKRKAWAEAEAYCEEVLTLYSKSFAGQEEQLNTNLGIQYYQLTVVKRNLKKLDEAVECAIKAYQHIIQSKLKPEFSSAIARQRADILDGLNRYDEAKAVMIDHIERMEAKHKASLEAKQEKDKTVKSEEDDEISPDESQSPENMVSPNNLTDNMLFLARLQFEHEEYDEAVTWLRKAIEVFPSPYYSSMLAAVLFDAGRVDEALEVQAQLKKTRTTGDFPIAASRNLLTKVHYLRQSKLDGPWTVHIQVTNQAIKTLDDTLRLKPGSLLELYVRRHYNADEAVAGAAVTMGPFVYIVKGDEPDNILTIKGILPQALQSNAVYEIVIRQYPSQNEKSPESLLGTHRQLARAMAYSSLSMSNLMGPPDDFSDDLDDYALPEPSEDQDNFSELSNASSSALPAPASSSSSAKDSEVADEVFADDEAAVQAAAIPTETKSQKVASVAVAESIVDDEPIVDDEIIVDDAPIAVETAPIVEDIVDDLVEPEPASVAVDPDVVVAIPEDSDPIEPPTPAGEEESVDELVEAVQVVDAIEPSTATEEAVVEDSEKDF
jgi:tetratricopeptide (TPR) repeat protein